MINKIDVDSKAGVAANDEAIFDMPVGETDPADEVPRDTRILAVDDNESKRYGIVRNLKQAGFVVDEATTGEEALRLLELSPSLVVLDVNLPDISGLEICRRIRESPATANLPILHLSETFTDTDSRIRCLNAGADVYMAEPVGGPELVATVRALLRAREAEWKAKKAEIKYRRLSETYQHANLKLSQELAERKRLEAELREKAHLIDLASDAIFGQIWAESVPGKGTSFYFTLPA